MSLGHVFFAVTMIALGIVGVVTGSFTPTWSGVSRGVPAREVLAYLCALVSFACGIGLLLPRTAVVASRVLLAYLLIWLLVVRTAWIVRVPSGLNPWWSLGDTAVMLAAAWVLHEWFADAGERQRLRFTTGDRGLRIARALYGLAMIPFGVAHFINLKDTADAVPAWLPWHTAWASFTGAAFIAAGVAVLFGVYPRLAASLSALQMGLFTLLVWVPFVVAGPNAFQWSEFLDSWALTAGAWVVADSYRPRTPGADRSRLTAT
jgi:uncharacterized membrane protein